MGGGSILPMSDVKDDLAKRSAGTTDLVVYLPNACWTMFILLRWQGKVYEHNALLRGSGALHGGALHGGALHGGADQWRLHGGAASFALMPTYRLARSRMHPAVHQPAVVTAPQPMPGAVQASFASICMWNWTPSLPWLRDSRHRPHPCRLQLARRPSLLNRSRTHAF